MDPFLQALASHLASFITMFVDQNHFHLFYKCDSRDAVVALSHCSATADSSARTPAIAMISWRSRNRCMSVYIHIYMYIYIYIYILYSNTYTWEHIDVRRK